MGDKLVAVIGMGFICSPDFWCLTSATHGKNVCDWWGAVDVLQEWPNVQILVGIRKLHAVKTNTIFKLMTKKQHATDLHVSWVTPESVKTCLSVHGNPQQMKLSQLFPTTEGTCHKIDSGSTVFDHPDHWRQVYLDGSWLYLLCNVYLEIKFVFVHTFNNYLITLFPTNTAGLYIFFRYQIHVYVLLHFKTGMPMVLWNHISLQQIRWNKNRRKSYLQKLHQILLDGQQIIANGNVVSPSSNVINMGYEG